MKSKLGKASRKRKSRDSSLPTQPDGGQQQPLNPSSTSAAHREDEAKAEERLPSELASNASFTSTLPLSHQHSPFNATADFSAFHVAGIDLPTAERSALAAQQSEDNVLFESQQRGAFSSMNTLVGGSQSQATGLPLHSGFGDDSNVSGRANNAAHFDFSDSSDLSTSNIFVAPAVSRAVIGGGEIDSYENFATSQLTNQQGSNWDGGFCFQQQGPVDGQASTRPLFNSESFTTSSLPFASSSFIPSRDDSHEYTQTFSTSDSKKKDVGASPPLVSGAELWKLESQRNLLPNTMWVNNGPQHRNDDISISTVDKTASSPSGVQFDTNTTESEPTPEEILWRGAGDAPRDGRRTNRNRREQERAQKITQQIKELQTILHGSRVPFQPNKFSTLKCVVDYIKQLQSHCRGLDDEKKKLVQTIQGMNEVLSAGNLAEESNNLQNEDTTLCDIVHGNAHGDQSSADILKVTDIDFRSIFNNCGAAMGIASLDGRFIACNQAFERIAKLSRQQIFQLSLFHMLPSDSDIEQVFSRMGQMLSDRSQRSVDAERQMPGTAVNADEPFPTYWTGIIISPTAVASGKTEGIEQQTLQMSVTLAIASDGIPKFFNCVLTEL